MGGIRDKNLQSLIGSFTDPSRAVIKCHNVLKYIYLTPTVMLESLASICNTYKQNAQNMGIGI